MKAYQDTTETRMERLALLGLEIQMPFVMIRTQDWANMMHQMAILNEENDDLYRLATEKDFSYRELFVKHELGWRGRMNSVIDKVLGMFSRKRRIG